MVTIVVLTIFIYASYSSTQTLAPPPMRNSALSASLVAFSMANNRSNSVSNSEAETAAASANVKNSRAILTHYDNLPPAGGGSHGNEMIFVKKLTHHREPTIDENAIDGGGEAGAAAAGTGGGTGAGSGGMGDDLVGDDTALEHFNNNNNDLLQEEQYVQSVDNNLGKFCNVIIE